MVKFSPYFLVQHPYGPPYPLVTSPLNGLKHSTVDNAAAESFLPAKVPRLVRFPVENNGWNMEAAVDTNTRYRKKLYVI